MNGDIQESDAFDIIIIGAGTAGSVLAHRLSSQSSLSVLVLEAGENRSHDPNIYTPGLNTKLWDNDNYDWRFKTEPEPGLGGRSIKQPRGKVVGGSSAINSFALLYPNRAGINVWEKMGCNGWGWETLQPYFEKFQTLGTPSMDVKDQLSLAHSDEAIRRSQGPLQTSFPSKIQPLQKAWVESWGALGLENSADAFQGTAIGGHTSVCHISPNTKQRSHAGEAFLASTESHGNLTVITGALVQRIVFSKGANAAAGTHVDYVKNEESYRVHARTKVVLAAGSLSSSCILERSGIGDQKRLSALDVPLIYHNAAVGENLQDHVRAAVHFEAADHVPPRTQLPESELRWMYETDRSGPWSESACWAFSYMPLSPFVKDSEQAEWKSKLERDIAENPPSDPFEKQLSDYIYSMLSSPHEAAATAFLSRRPYPPVQPIGQYENDQPTNWIVLCAMLSHPLSRGSVHIASPSAEQHPKINCNYYGNDLDLEVHARIVKGLEKLATTTPLSKYLKLDGRRVPQVNQETPLDEIKEALRMYAGTNYHPVGTCSMLPEEVGGVVNEKLKVYGTTNVHVVDASIMPVIPRSNVISTVYAVAERAADLLLEEII